MSDQDDLNGVQEFVFKLLRGIESTANGEAGPKHTILANGLTSLALTVKLREVQVALELSSNGQSVTDGKGGWSPGIDLHIQPGGTCTKA